MYEYKGYTGVIEDVEDGEFYGKILGIKDTILFKGTTAAEMEADFKQGIDGYLDYCAKNGQVPDKPYTGKLSLRITPELHKKAEIEAAKEKLSVNKWIEKTIQAA